MSLIHELQTQENPWLNSILGIGRVLATIILLETGSIERFDAVGNFASYARCVDSQHVSNGKKKGKGNTKNDNKYLAEAFVEAANFALRFCPEVKRFYEHKKFRKKYDGGNQGVGPQVGASLFPYSEGAQTEWLSDPGILENAYWRDFPDRL